MQDWLGPNHDLTMGLHEPFCPICKKVIGLLQNRTIKDKTSYHSECLKKKEKEQDVYK